MRLSRSPGKGRQLRVGRPLRPSPYIWNRKRRRDLVTNGGTVLLEKARRASAFGGLADPFSAHEEASTGLKNHVITRRNPPTRC
jgi:hypothetical protein